MPPWGIDPHVGIQSFKNDPSLRDDEIETIAKWVDAGAPMGNAADMPKPREFDDSDRWHIGKPDRDRHLAEARRAGRSRRLVGQLLRRHRPHRGSLHQGDREQAGQDRRRPSPADLRRRRRHDRRQQRRRQQRRTPGEFLNEFAVGKNGDLFPEGTGRLLKAGSKIKFDFHYHSVGQEITDQSQLGIVLYPKGYTPKHVVYSKQLGQPTEPLDIPGGSTYVRSDGYTRFNKAGKITAFQPHMHTRGKRQCIPRVNFVVSLSRCASPPLRVGLGWPS